MHLEVVTQLLAESRLDGLEDVGEDTKVGRVVLIVVTTLEHTSADQARVPAVHVSTDDVGGRVVANHVDVLGQLLLAVELAHPAGHDLVSVLVGGHLGLTVDDTLQVDASEGLVHGLEADAEGTLGHARVRVLAGAQQVTLGEVNGDALGDGVLGAGAEDTSLGLQEIHDDLHVGGVVARVTEDEDGLNVDLAEVTRPRGRTLLVGEDTVRRDRRVPGNNVVGHDNVLEAVLLGDLSALVALTTNHEHRLVVFRKSRHGSVRLDELVDVDRLAENLGELLATRLLGLSRSVREAAKDC